MRAIERKLREVLESKKNERLSRDRISEIIKEVSEIKPEASFSRPSSIDNITLRLLRHGVGGDLSAVTIENIVTEVLNFYPEKNRDVLFSTTKRRLGGYLKNKVGVNIVKRTDENGKTYYRIPSEEEAEPIEAVAISGPEFSPSLIIVP